MIVSSNNKPYIPQQQRPKSKSSEFRAIYANMSAQNSGKSSGTQVHMSECTESPKEDRLELSRLVNASHPTLVDAWNEAEVFVFTPPAPTYPDSIYDLSSSELADAHLAAIQACRCLNISGMTKAEIYNAYESLFKDYLGADFQEPQLTCFDRNSLAGRGLVFQNFESVLKSAGGVDIYSNPEIILEARGYTGMSKDEIRAAVREQYPATMSLRQTIVMSYELSQLGVDRYYGWDISMAIRSTLGGTGSASRKIYDALLDMPSDFDAMKRNFDKFLANDRVMPLTYNMNEVFDQLMAWIGGNSSSSNKILTLLKEMEESGELSFNSYGNCVIRK